MDRLLPVIFSFLFMSCGIFRRKNWSDEGYATEEIALKKEPKKEENTSSKIKTDEESYYQEYIAVDRSDMPYEKRVDSYVNEFSGIAMAEMIKYSIPASITLAQGVLESGVGMGTLARRSNNHFGIKCHKGWKGSTVRHDDDEKAECFRSYYHPYKSYEDHSLFLKNRNRYSPLFSLKRDDYRAWAKGLKKAGYATDPHYSHKLIRLIETYNLQRYDKIAIDRKRRKKLIKRRGINVAKNKKRTSGNKYPSHKIHVVKKGDTLYSLSRRYDVSIETLRKLNSIKGNYISVGQQLILGKNKVQ